MAGVDFDGKTDGTTALTPGKAVLTPGNEDRRPQTRLPWNPEFTRPRQYVGTAMGHAVAVPITSRVSGFESRHRHHLQPVHKPLVCSRGLRIPALL